MTSIMTVRSVAIITAVYTIVAAIFCGLGSSMIVPPALGSCALLLRTMIACNLRSSPSTDLRFRDPSREENFLRAFASSNLIYELGNLSICFLVPIFVGPVFVSTKAAIAFGAIRVATRALWALSALLGLRARCPRLHLTYFALVNLIDHLVENTLYCAIEAQRHAAAAPPHPGLMLFAKKSDSCAFCPYELLDHPNRLLPARSIRKQHFCYMHHWNVSPGLRASFYLHTTAPLPLVTTQSKPLPLFPCTPAVMTGYFASLLGFAAGGNTFDLSSALFFWTVCHQCFAIYCIAGVPFNYTVMVVGGPTLASVTMSVYFYARERALRLRFAKAQEIGASKQGALVEMKVIRSDAARIVYGFQNKLRGSNLDPRMLTEEEVEILEENLILQLEAQGLNNPIVQLEFFPGCILVVGTVSKDIEGQPGKPSASHSLPHINLMSALPERLRSRVADTAPPELPSFARTLTLECSPRALAARVPPGGNMAVRLTARSDLPIAADTGTVRPLIWSMDRRSSVDPLSVQWTYPEGSSGCVAHCDLVLPPVHSGSTGQTGHAPPIDMLHIRLAFLGRDLKRASISDETTGPAPSELDKGRSDGQLSILGVSHVGARVPVLPSEDHVRELLADGSSFDDLATVPGRAALAAGRRRRTGPAAAAGWAVQDGPTIRLASALSKHLAGRQTKKLADLVRAQLLPILKGKEEVSAGEPDPTPAWFLCFRRRDWETRYLGTTLLPYTIKSECIFLLITFLATIMLTDVWAPSSMPVYSVIKLLGRTLWIASIFSGFRLRNPRLHTIFIAIIRCYEIYHEEMPLAIAFLTRLRPSLASPRTWLAGFLSVFIGHFSVPVFRINVFFTLAATLIRYRAAIVASIPVAYMHVPMLSSLVLLAFHYVLEAICRGEHSEKLQLELQMRKIKVQ